MEVEQRESMKQLIANKESKSNSIRKSKTSWFLLLQVILIILIAVAIVIFFILF